MSEENEGQPIVYVALGDSTGAGVGARKGGGYVARLFERVGRARPGSRLVNLCVSGATTVDVLRGQVGRVGDAKPSLVTVGVGMNDLKRMSTPEEFARNFEEIVTRIRAQTDAAFVVSNLPDISRAPRVPDFLRADVLHGIRLYNERITDVAARQRLHLADTFEKSVAVIPSHPEFFSADGFHPSDEGYEFWAFEMWPVVKRALGWER